MSSNAEYIARMESQISQWDAELVALKEKGKKMAGDLRAAYFDRLKELHAGRGEAQKKMQEIRSASEEAAAQLHAGMEGAWESMRAAMETVSSDLRKK